MGRRDWLLLLLAYQGAPDGLDPVRIQKSMFLLRKDPDAQLPADEAYDFEPYSYGPMSKAIYSDLEALVGQGLALRVRVEGQSWSLFRATGRGLIESQRLVDGLTSRNIPAARKLFDIKHLVAGKTFSELVEYVYDRYPEYESRTIFRRPSLR